MDLLKMSKIGLLFLGRTQQAPVIPEGYKSASKAPNSLLARSVEGLEDRPPLKTSVPLVTAINEIVGDPQRGLIIDVSQYSRKNNTLRLSYLERDPEKSSMSPKQIKELSALIKYKISRSYPWVHKVQLLKEPY
jgi:hypothetical protein